MIPGVTAINGDAAPWTALFADRFDERAVAPIATLLSNTQRIISFVSTGDDAWAANVRRLAPQVHIAFVPPRPPASWTHHVCDWHRQCLREQGVELTNVPVAPRHNPDGPIVIHPGSGGIDKCWPLDRFEMLIEHLSQRGQKVSPIIGEAEIERWPRDTLERWRQRWNVETVLTLDRLHVVLSTARLYIGNDSGPTHLAAQLGVATLALFGPTDARVWSPRGPSVKVLSPAIPRPMDWLDVPRVVGAI